MALTPRPPWKGKRVVLGVTGGIAAYKSIQVARDLTRLGADVDVVLTASAQNFVAPLTFEGVTGRRPLTDMFSAEGAALHIRLGRDADVVCVAPATADFLARSAQGRADDLLTTTLLATRAPVVLCPAMNDRMFEHRQVQENLRHLRDELGYTVEGPADRTLADRGGHRSRARSLPDDGRAARPGDGRTHAGAHRPGSVRREPVVGTHGLRQRPGGVEARCRGDAGERADRTRRSCRDQYST